MSEHVTIVSPEFFDWLLAMEAEPYVPNERLQQAARLAREVVVQQ